MLSKIKKFFDLPISDKLLLMKITLLVPLVEVGLKTIKFKKTFNILNFFIPQNTKQVENELKLVNLHRNLLFLYQRQFPFLGKCLAHSLCIWLLLSRKGIKTEMKFGMKKENGELLAHAWLEHNGITLELQNETDRQYIPFSESILAEISKQ